MISGFRSEVDEKCTLIGYYAESSGDFLPTFRDNLSVPSPGVKNSFFPFLGGFLTPEDGTDRLSRNVGKKSPLLAA